MSHKLKQTLTAHNSSALNFINVRMSPRSAELRLDKDFLSVLDIFFSLLGSIKLKSCFAPSICSLNLEILLPLLSKIESIRISFIYTSVLKRFWQRKVLPKKIWVFEYCYFHWMGVFWMKCLKKIYSVPEFSDLSPQMGIFLRVTFSGMYGRAMSAVYCNFLKMVLAVEMNFQEGNAII